MGRAGTGANSKTLLARSTENGGELGNQEHAIAHASAGRAIVGYPAGQGFAVAGSVTSSASTSAVVARFSEPGQLTWSQKFSETNTDFEEFMAVALIGSDVVAVGDVVFGGTPQVYVVRVSAAGKEMWRKMLTPFVASHGTGVAVYGNWLALSVWGTLTGNDAGISVLDVFGNEHNSVKQALVADQQLTGIASFGDGTFAVHGSASGVVSVSLARTNAYMATDCTVGACAQLPGNLCDDGNPCTQNSCTPSNAFATKAFSDGSACAAGRTCGAGGGGP